MAHLRCDFFSDALGLGTSMTVLLPQRTTTRIGLTGAAGDRPPPVLYLLHGLSDDDTAWVRNTAIERYVEPLGLAVVLPQVHRSFYTDQSYGGAYWTFVSAELPEIVHSFFRLSHEPSDTFVAGLSMGGYAALKLALRQPERFAAAASLSGALDVARLAAAGSWEDDPRLFDRVFGNRDVTGSDDDLLALVRRHAGSGAGSAGLPALYVACGTEDALLADNRRFVAASDDAGVAVQRQFGPGEHEWSYWDARIQDVLAWLPLRSA